MLPWAKEAVRSCSTMKSVQKTADKVNKRRSDAQGEVQSLEENVRDDVMKRFSIYSLLTHLIFLLCNAHMYF